MNPSLDELMTRRASLRTKYDEAVSKLLQALDSHPKPTYSRDDLTKLRITLGTFNPDIPSFGTSLFEPMSPEKLAGFSLKMSEQSQNTQNLHNRYDELYNRLPDQAGIVGYRQPNGREADIFYRNLESTSSYLGRLYKGSYKRTRRSHEFLTDTSKWTQLADGNPFEELPVGFLGGYSPNAQIPRWYVEANYEWQDNPRDPSTIRPHMMLVVRTGAIAVVGELLFCELACIAQVIKNRLQQEDFTRTSLFPVLLLLLCGPRHGRIVQAKYKKSGILKVRTSQIYTFERMVSAPWDLFLRYYVCYPHDGPDMEFASDEEEPEVSVVPPPVSQYVSHESSPRRVLRNRRDKNPSTQKFKHASPKTPKAGKENVSRGIDDMNKLTSHHEMSCYHGMVHVCSFIKDNWCLDPDLDRSENTKSTSY